MSDEELLLRINKVFCEAYESDIKVDYNSTFDDDGLDSFCQINIIFLIEKEFNIAFNMDQIDKMKNVADMINVLKGLLNE